MGGIDCLAGEWSFCIRPMADIHRQGDSGWLFFTSHLRYLGGQTATCSPQASPDEVGYVFQPAEYGYCFELNMRCFSGKRRKNYRRELGTLEAQGTPSSLRQEFIKALPRTVDLADPMHNAGNVTNIPSLVTQIQMKGTSDNTCINQPRRK
jgi:hypothetical protein